MLPACSQTVEKKIFNEVNPISYVFNWPLEDVKNAIFYGFDDFKYNDLVLCYKGGVFHPLDTSNIFQQVGNNDDFYLMSRPSNFFYGKSRLYSIEGKPLDYTASFHIHLESVENIQTVVKVVTINPRVAVGTNALPQGPHLVKPIDYMKVAPSTIEEYEILFEIGRILGEKKMPPIKYPSP